MQRMDRIMQTFETSRDYYSFESEVRNRQRYVRPHKVESFLAKVRSGAKQRVSCVRSGSTFFRAQVGMEEAVIERSDGTYELDTFPFGKGRMKPIAGRATEGRANPKGIPYLYLATTKETAMSEVRPWIGAKISLGRFDTLRELRIVDCSRGHEHTPLLFEEPPEDQLEEVVWASIASGFSKPVTLSDQTADYVATQIIAELFRDEGYDGVAYKSNFGEDGYNLVLFDLDAAELRTCTIFEVGKVNFEFKQWGNAHSFGKSS